MANKGTVKFFKAEKGYGFIECSGGVDVFVHITDLKDSGHDTINKGDKVEFDIVDNRGKTKAKNISIIN